MWLFAVIVGLLFCFAIIDLMVGVSNDAVNFLNSSMGSRVAPRKTILIIAGFGILAGVTFSSGMMEVARKGIFHPSLFFMPELITIFLAVMLTDVLLLDLFNTFGLPTSTTVSIVFELLGAAVAISLVKIFSNGQSILQLPEYINTAKALAIISGILLSIGIAFFSGAIVQFLTRVLFTFNYQARLKRYGAVWCGFALTMITYFILIKGSKGASFITPLMMTWIKTHTLAIIVCGFIGFSILFQIVITFTRINVLKPVVLTGTFALAMAFAANDLVNFIGVPLAGFHAFDLAKGAASPTTLSMGAMQKSVQTNTFFLLAAGAVMVTTLWFSRKSRTVTKTELSLGRQEEGLERFNSTSLARIVVRAAVSLIEKARWVCPEPVQRLLKSRLDTDGFKPASGYDGNIPEFDLLRASVNLMVASALVAWATSMKLPLSTTYVTFMVAMGTSMADQAWGLESAVYRVTGVLTVIGGWFITAFLAFTVSLCFAFLIHQLGWVAIFGLMVLAAYIIFRNIKIHGSREKAEQELELADLKRIQDAAYASQTCFEQSGRYLSIVRDNLNHCFDGILTQDRKLLRQLRRETSKVQKWSNIIAANTFKSMRLFKDDQIKQAGKYAAVIAALQGVSESLRDMILRCYVHTNNQHAGLIPVQKKELQQVRKCVESLLNEISGILLRSDSYNYRDVARNYVDLKHYLENFDQNQIERIHNGLSKTRLSLLYYGINNACLNIGEQVLKLLTLYNETLCSDTFYGEKKITKCTN
ncbi:MAG: inorganic phosphate transporter [Desulfobacteraceae bacterium]|nr:inorganic phosphate transporter [Desulfobacteraceae bacterium]